MRLSELEEYISRVSNNFGVPYQMHLVNNTCIQYVTTILNYSTGQTFTLSYEAHVNIPNTVNMSNLFKSKRSIEVLMANGNISRNNKLMTSISLLELPNRVLYQKTVNRLIQEKTEAVY